MFNQYLIVDEPPLLFHGGLRKMIPLVREAVASVIPVQSLREYLSSSVDADECESSGSQWRPKAAPLCDWGDRFGVDGKPG
jgi:hypothetical protein